MRLLGENELGIKLLSNGSDTVPPTSEIVRSGGRTGTTVNGAILEAAIAWNDGYLIFLTDDIPHEDTLNIYLLDKEMRYLDSATLGGVYSTGSFKLQKLSEPNIIRFRFIGDTDWSVELLPQPKYRVPFFSEPIGVSRNFGFSRHFKVQGKPRPESR